MPEATTTSNTASVENTEALTKPVVPQINEELKKEIEDKLHKISTTKEGNAAWETIKKQQDYQAKINSIETNKQVAENDEALKMFKEIALKIHEKEAFVISPEQKIAMLNLVQENFDEVRKNPSLDNLNAALTKIGKGENGNGEKQNNVPDGVLKAIADAQLGEFQTKRQQEVANLMERVTPKNTENQKKETDEEQGESHEEDKNPNQNTSDPQQKNDDLNKQNASIATAKSASQQENSKAVKTAAIGITTIVVVGAGVGTMGLLPMAIILGAAALYYSKRNADLKKDKRIQEKIDKGISEGIKKYEENKDPSELQQRIDAAIANNEHDANKKNFNDVLDDTHDDMKHTATEAEDALTSASKNLAKMVSPVKAQTQVQTQAQAPEQQQNQPPIDKNKKVLDDGKKLEESSDSEELTHQNANQPKPAAPVLELGGEHGAESKTDPKSHVVKLGGEHPGAESTIDDSTRTPPAANTAPITSQDISKHTTPAAPKTLTSPQNGDTTESELFGPKNEGSKKTTLEIGHEESHTNWQDRVKSETLSKSGKATGGGARQPR